MEVKDMKLTEVQERIKELRAFEPEGATLEEIQANTVELRALNDREEAIMKAAEERKAEIEKVVNMPNPEVIATFKEERKMEDKKTFGVETAEYRKAFFENLMGRPVDEEARALVSAAAVIPTITWDKIVEKMEYVAPIVSKVTVTQIPGYMTIPVEGTTGDAAVVAMGTAATDASDTVTSVTLNAYKLIKTVPLGVDTTTMSVDQFENYIVSKLYKKMAKAVENLIINGAGTTEATGLLASGVITNTGTFTKAAMTYTDLLTIIADLPDAGYRQEACFVMPSALFYSDVLPALTDKGSGLDVQAVEKMKILNYDVILCDRVAADTIIFGDLSYYHWNWAKDVEIASDKSVDFRTGNTVYRALALCDGKTTNAAAFNKYTRALS